jgi:hypothetical protein
MACRFKFRRSATLAWAAASASPAIAPSAFAQIVDPALAAAPSPAPVPLALIGAGLAAVGWLLIRRRG